MAMSILKEQALRTAWYLRQPKTDDLFRDRVVKKLNLKKKKKFYILQAKTLNARISLTSNMAVQSYFQ